MATGRRSTDTRIDRLSARSRGLAETTRQLDLATQEFVQAQDDAVLQQWANTYPQKGQR